MANTKGIWEIILTSFGLDEALRKIVEIGILH